MSEPTATNNRYEISAELDSDPKLESDKELSQYYVNTLKPQILTALRRDLNLEWVSFTLLKSGTTPVLHIGAVDSNDPSWESFKSVIAPAVQMSPKKVTLEITDEILTELAGIV